MFPRISIPVDSLPSRQTYSTASVVVTKHNVKNSIAIAVWDGKGLVPVGNVTMIGHERPVVNTVVEVKYLYAYPGGCLYQPAFIGVRDDTDKEDCLISKLKFKYGTGE